jgi:hypothetical protein
MASGKTVEPGSFVPLAESTAANHDLKKSQLLTYSTIIITNRSPVRTHEIAFLLRFRFDERTGSNP